MNSKSIGAVALGVLVISANASADDHVLSLPLDECGGVVAFDVSGSGNHAQLFGPSWVSGICGFATNLDGQDDYLLVQDSSSLSALGSATIEVWFRPDAPYDPAPRHQTLLHKWGPGGTWDDEYVIYLYDGVLRFHASGSADREISFPVALLQQSTWHYLAAVVDAASQSIVMYLDGELVASGSFPGSMNRDTAEPLYIGGFGGSWFDGALDDIRISRRAMSADEILTNFQQHCAPILRLPFDEGTGIIVQDGSGYNNDGILIGSVSWTSDAISGTALDFSGGYVSVPNSNSLQPSDQLTMEAWVKWDTTGGQEMHLVGKKVADGGGWDLIKYTDDRIYVRVHPAGQPIRQAITASTVVPGVWYYLVGTYDGSTLSVYLNGVLSGSNGVSGQLPFLDREVAVGRESFSHRFPMDGKIDEVYVWERALTPGEVYARYRGTIMPDSFSIVRGGLTAGSLCDLFLSDDLKLEIRAGLTLFLGESPLQVVVTGTSSVQVPGELRFKIEASVNTPGLTQTIELFNYDTSSYEEVVLSVPGAMDAIIEVVITTNPERFIQAGTREMRAKVSYRQIGLTLLWPWSAGLDQAAWTILP